MILYTALVALALVGAHADPPEKLGVRQSDGCSDDQRTKVEAARQKALTRLRAAAKRTQADAKRKAAPHSAMSIDTESDYFQLLVDDTAPDTLKDAENSINKIWLILKRAEIHCAARNDGECGTRGGYVRGAKPPIHLCQGFFKADASGAADVIVHEGAHLLRDDVTDKDGQGNLGYCLIFDCQNRCSDGKFPGDGAMPYLIADNWAHYVHCASGAPPEKGEEISAGPAKKK
jgi:hypothetical protein